MKDLQPIKKLFDAILLEARSNPEFAQRLREALGQETRTEPRRRATPDLPQFRRSGTRASHRRPAPVIDPFAIYGTSPGSLGERLDELTLDQLKDIVAEYGMDSARLAMKWQNKSRLIDLIVRSVEARSHRGDAFRRTSAGPPVPDRTTPPHLAPRTELGHGESGKPSR